MGRRKYRGSRDKYSVEQTATVAVVPAATATAPGQSGIVIVPPTATQGMRKVKHITVSLAQPGQVSTANSPTSVFWALVYVPQGTTPNQLSLTGSSMYEPNQFVMNCGTFDCNAGPVRFHSPISRNLNSGDKIYLIIANPNQSAQGVFLYTVRYAVTLQ